LRRRLRHRYWAFAALACLTLRLVIAVLHVPAAGAAPSGEFPSQVVLCTASGMWIVQLDENGEPFGPKVPAIGQDCPVCTTLLDTPIAPLPRLAGPSEAFATPLAAPQRRTALVIERKPGVLRSRAPPSKS
jgi:hypothetical protein